MVKKLHRDDLLYIKSIDRLGRNYKAWKGGRITACKAAQICGLSSSAFYYKVGMYESEKKDPCGHKDEIQDLSVRP